jgi:hypothetical protein
MVAALAVTVAIPTYRRPEKFRRALESALAQTYQPTAIVVGDDGSQSEVRDIVASMSDPRISYYPRTSKLRMTENWDFVLGWADGGLVALLEDDNFWRPAHLEHAVDVLRRYPEAALYHCAKDDAFDDARELKYQQRHKPPPWHDELTGAAGGIVPTATLLYDALACGSINASTVVIRRPILDAVPRFDHRYLMGMDTLMWTRIAMAAPVVYGPWSDVVYTYHSDNVSREELITRRATVHARAARRLLLAEALANATLTPDQFEADLQLLPAATAAPIVILAGDRRQPAAIRTAARRVFSRRADIRGASGHLRLAALVGFNALAYTAAVDRGLSRLTQLIRRFRVGQPSA